MAVLGGGFTDTVEMLDPPRRDWYFLAEQPAPAPHLSHPEGCAALCIPPVRTTRLEVMARVRPLHRYLRGD